MDPSKKLARKKVVKFGIYLGQYPNIQICNEEYLAFSWDFVQIMGVPTFGEGGGGGKIKLFCVNGREVNRPSDILVNGALIQDFW